jgi:formamidopyrimidine-DNA glycosylase
MPELPEVEIVRGFLEKKLVGRKIISVNVFLAKFLKNIKPEVFQSKLKGKKVVCVERHGKNLLIFFDNYVLLNHLRMAGK